MIATTCCAWTRCPPGATDNSVGRSTSRPAGRLERPRINPIDHSIDVIIEAEEVINPPTFVDDDKGGNGEAERLIVGRLDYVDGILERREIDREEFEDCGKSVDTT